MREKGPRGQKYKCLIFVYCMSNFYDCYNELCRNIVNLIHIIPESVSIPTEEEIFTLMQEVENNRFYVL